MLENLPMDEMRLVIDFLEEMLIRFKEISLKQGFLLSHDEARAACASLIRNLVLNSVQTHWPDIDIDDFEVNKLGKFLAYAVKNPPVKQHIIDMFADDKIDWEAARKQLMEKLNVRGS